MGVQPAGPMPDPFDAGDLTLAGLSVGSAPLSGNVAGHSATGVLCEYQVPSGNPYDGHFVVFQDATAIRQSSAFLATHARSGVASLIP